MKRVKNSAGFTLMELLVTLAIVAILAAMAAPSLESYIENNRLSAHVSDLVTAMQASRVEAIGRNSYVTLCKKNTGATDCLTSGGWQQGWIIFVDADGDGTVDAGDEMLAIHDELMGKVTFYGTSQVADRITFRPSGQTSITSLQTLILCDTRGFGDKARGMVVSIMGRASAMAATGTNETTCLVPE